MMLKLLKNSESTFEEDSGEYKSFVSVTNQILNSPLGDLDPQLQIHSWNEILRQYEFSNSTDQSEDYTRWIR